MATPVALDALPTTRSFGTGDALAAIMAALDGIHHAARAGLTGEARLALVTRARAVSRRIEALTVTLVAEADARSASLVTRGTPTTSWLALDPATTSKEAAGLVFAAADTTRYAAVRDAALAGRVGVGQARAIAKGLGDLPASLTAEQRESAVGLFLARGAELPAARIGALEAQILAEVAPEAAPSTDDHLAALDAQTRRAHSRRSLTFTPDGDGSLLVQGSLPVLDAAPFVRLIEAGVEAERRAGRDRAADRTSCDLRSGAQRRADALLALVATGHQARHGASVAHGSSW